MRTLLTILSCLPAVVMAVSGESRPLDRVLEPLGTWQKRSMSGALADARKEMARLWESDRKAFLACLASGNDLVSSVAADALDGAQASGASEWALKTGLAHEDARVRCQSACHLGRMRVREAAPALARLLASDDSKSVREACARALSRIGGDDEVEALSEASRHDESDAVQRAATLALGWIGTRRAGDALLGAARGVHLPDGTREALRILTGTDRAGDSVEEARKWWEDFAPPPAYAVGNAEEVAYGRARRTRGEPRRILFVLDLSGSIPPAYKASYRQALFQVPDGVFFDVVLFGGNGATAWQGFLVESTQPSRAKAAAWLCRYLNCNSTTPLSSALKRAFRDYDVDEMRLYTDGAGNSGVSGGDLEDYLRALNVCRRIRLKGYPPAGMHPGLDRAIQESGDGL